MSSVRGGTFRGGGRGSTPSTSSRGRGISTTRGRVANNNAPRGSNTTRGGFGQPSRQNANRAPRGPSNARPNGPVRQPSSAGALGGGRTKGSWQERYQMLMKARERERNDAIRQGLIADPEKPRSLSEAITPIGTCREMCAEYERVQRVVQKDVWDEETDPNHSVFSMTDKEPDESRMVKKFRRAAAGLEEQLPSDLRPPAVLKQTCDYLFNEVIGNAPSLAQVHHFVWDRTRAVRNDFSIQQVTRPAELRIAIDCYERIARFHMLSLHQLALPEKPYSKYDWQQEREQLDRTLLSLMQMYDDSRGRINLPNEAEFRAYCVIFQLQDPTPDLEDRVQSWPKNVIRDARVQKAVDVYMAACNVMDAQGPLKPRANHLIARQDWQRFWTLVASQEVSYLMACVAEIYFNLIRRTVLNALFRTFRANANLATPDWTTDALCELLAFDDEDEVYTYCERFGFSFKEREDGQHFLDLTSVRGRTLPEPNSAMSKQSRTKLVEDKRYGRTIPAVINGMTVKQAEDAGLVEEAEMDEGMEDVATRYSEVAGPPSGTMDAGASGEDDGDSLFIPESIATRPSVPSNEVAKSNGPSIFSGFNAQSTFGKPSSFEDQSSVFAQPQIESAGSISTTDRENKAATFDFMKSSSAAPAVAAPPLFDFTKAQDSTSSKQRDESIPNNFSFGRSPMEQSDIATDAATQAKDRAPLFSFNPSSDAVNPEVKKQGQSQNPPLATTYPSNLQSNPLFAAQPVDQLNFGQPTAAPASAPSPSQQPETKVPQPHFTPSSTSPISTSNQPSHSSGISSGVKRSSFSTDTKPKKPSPLVNSFTANDDSSAVAGEPSVGVSENTSAQGLFPDRRLQTQPPTVVSPSVEQRTETVLAKPTEDIDSIVTRLADELVYEPDTGYLKQYVEFAVGRTISKALEQITTERLNQEADDHRQISLQIKYGNRWRALFWQRRLVKTGRERRERRQRRLVQRESEETDPTSPFESRSEHAMGAVSSVFRTAIENFGRENLSSSRQLSNPERLHSTIPINQQAIAGSKRPMSSQGEEKSTASQSRGHKRFKSTSHVDDRGRVSKLTAINQPNADILKRSSFLGFSVSRDAGNNKSTTKSNYFRLKAMGVNKADELSGVRGMKRRSDSLQTMSQTSPPALRPSSLASSPDAPTSKSPALQSTSKNPRIAEARADDEALFARLKAARENLKDSTSFYKSETGKDNELRESASSRSSNESPSMANGRIDAKLRASVSASESASRANGSSVPAYRLRESKFVPREHYGRAIERAREVRESRSRETSRPESRLENDHDDASSKHPNGSFEQADRTKQQNHDQPHKTQPLGYESSGFRNRDDTETQPSVLTSTSSKPFSFGTQAPLTFANHTTQMSSSNPFLQAAVPDSQSHLTSKPAFGFEETRSAQNGFFRPAQQHKEHNFAIKPAFNAEDDYSNQDPFNQSIQQNSQTTFASKPSFGIPDAKSTAPSQDQTIHPSQINKSLANSFSSANGSAPYAFQANSHGSPTPPQQNSYLPSQAISLLSDDEEDENTVTQGHHAQFDSRTETDDANGELLDESTEDDEGHNPYGHMNPYAALAHDAEDSYESGSDVSDVDANHNFEYGEEQEYQSDDGMFDDEREESRNGYADDEDEDEGEEGVDGDTELDVSEDDEEDENGYDYREEDEYQPRGLDPYQRYDYDDSYNSANEKTAALQAVGNTAEEAIELSD